MSKNQTVLTKHARHEQIMRICLVALVMLIFMSFAITPSIMTSFAAVNEGPLKAVVGAVIGIIEVAAKYIGIVIVLWGVFNIIMALRREDSEAIGKQITTVAVGGVLAGFGFFIKPICSALGVDI